ncbi:MAG: T9SS type A sorting domain-containing protein [Candidatus Zixiibacteriota bacterium]
MNRYDRDYREKRRLPFTCNLPYPVMTLTVVLFVFMGAGMVFGQASSGSFTLVAGGLVGGGGTSASASAVITGVIPTSVSGVTSSTNYTAASGVIGIAYTTGLLTAGYAGGAIQTVTPGDHLLKVGYAGELGTATGTFNYRYGGRVTYTSVPMVAGTGDTLQYNCPASLFNLRGLEYFFQVYRGTSIASVGTPTAPYVFRVQYTNEECRSFQMGPRIYAIVGVPVSVSGGNTIADVFVDDLGAFNTEVWRLARWNATTGSYQEYASAPAVVPGRGYWVITRDLTDFGVAGVSMVPNATYGGNRYLSIPLQAGWNQIANPFAFPVSLLEAVVNDNGTMTSDFTGRIEDVGYYYNGSNYFTQTTFDPWDGVFLFAEKAGVELWLRYHEQGTAGKAVVDDLLVEKAAPSWQMELTMTSGDLGDVANYVGVCADANMGADVNDYREPPMAPEGVMLAYKLPDGSEGLRRTDYRPEFANGATWDVVFSEGSDRVVTARGVESIPQGMEAWLILTNAGTFRLGEGTEVRLPNDVFSAQLVIGNDGYAAGEVSSALPNQFGLSQNFPNPFNPTTSIRFALPQACHVELVVYNMLGQKVRTLVDQRMDAGHQLVEWDGRDGGGQQVASGVYFYRLNAADFSQTKKMMLLK